MKYILLFIYILFISIIFIGISEHDRKIIQHFFKSNNIAYYNKLIRNIIIKCKISDNTLGFVKKIIFLFYFIIIPPGSILFGLLHKNTYAIPLFKLVKFYLKNPFSLITELRFIILN